jgi:hypothetical protein
VTDLDLAAALREGGYGEIAAELEAKQLAGKLRESGRGDLADRLEGPPTRQSSPRRKAPRTRWRWGCSTT